MKKLFCFIIAYCLLPIAYSQSPYWQQQVNFRIDVTLNDVENTLDGYVKMDYYNNSPDTLHFIWIHLWPNAFKNDRTAYTDQALENGSTQFYFSDNDKRGYINRLDFKVNGITAKTEDHPIHQDIIKLILPAALLPGTKTKIETPFHVKLPYPFSRGGHNGGAYHITQWYPKPAVYDRKGWHPIPYLDQGEFYSEFGDYEVQVSLPKDYILAATGELQDEQEKEFLLGRTGKIFSKPAALKTGKTGKTVAPQPNSSTKEMKTLHYRQNNVHDFAWFADKEYNVAHDSLKLPSGRIIDAWAFFYTKHKDTWKNSIRYIKSSILTKSRWLGEYPYNVVSVVDGGNGGGMEYPTITLLVSGGTEEKLDHVIDHEIGHNWFYGILASNERLHPWMDEGMNTFYDTRYTMQQYNRSSFFDYEINLPFAKKTILNDFDQTALRTLIGLKKGQPIETASEKFSATGYNLIAYTKTGQWMELLEKELGRPLFDSCMQEYFRRWKFRHPYPEDFKKTMEDVSGRDLSRYFSLLNEKGALNKTTGQKKDTRIVPFIGLKETGKHNYISLAPAVGSNFYDGPMIGALVHNYTLPLPDLHFFAAPLYATRSKQLNGIGRIGYSWFPGNKGRHAEFAVAGATFSGDSFTDSNNTVHNLRFSKIVPSFKFTFANKNPRSSVTKFIQWKTFLINEQGVSFARDTVRQLDIISYPVVSRYVNQLQFVLENNRVLYPYKGTLQFEQGDGFVRTNFTGNYYFNYVKGGGLNLRIFAGKFFYLGDKTFIKQFKTDAYHLNMTGPKGYEDYTYSNYFVGRNEFDRLASQQIMIRDGGFKVRTDLLSNKIGKTDNWLAAINLSSDIPNAINPLSLFPVKIPIKLFLDIGTFAEAWKKGAETGRFVYDGGLQLSLLRNILNIYVPLVYSKVYSDYFKSTLTEKRFVKNIAFSIDLQNMPSLYNLIFK